MKLENALIDQKSELGDGAYFDLIVKANSIPAAVLRSLYEEVQLFLGKVYRTIFESKRR